jgi:hypothetical protein
MSLIRRRKSRVMPMLVVEPGLQQIDVWEQHMVNGNIQMMRENNYSAADLARRGAEVTAQIANIAAQMRADYLQSKQRP